MREPTTLTKEKIDFFTSNFKVSFERGKPIFWFMISGSPSYQPEDDYVYPMLMECFNDPKNRFLKLENATKIY